MFPAAGTPTGLARRCRGRSPKAFWDIAGRPLHDLRREIVMSAYNLAELYQGEIVTIKNASRPRVSARMGLEAFG